MLRRLLFAFSLFATSSGGLASTPIDTTDYFPLVGGSTYRYAVTGGGYATQDVSYTAGATWGGRTGLVQEETLSTCVPGRLCIAYKREYYAREADGARSAGIYAEFPSGAVESRYLSVGELYLKDPATPGVGTGGVFGTTFEDYEEWGGQVDGTSTNFGPQSYTYYCQARALETVVTPAGTFTGALRVWCVLGGYQLERWYAKGVGVVKWVDYQGPGPTNTALLTSYDIPSNPSPVVTASAVEFYHAAFDHYFVTADAVEINALDTGYFQGWARTGYSFKVVTAASITPQGASPVCRFYGDPAAGLDSHFYSASPVECDEVDANFPEWIWESDNVFQVYLPNTSTGACPAGTIPLYRVFNLRSDANHRYTTSTAVVDQMVARGGIAEGYGPGPHYPVMCSPQ